MFMKKLLLPCFYLSSRIRKMANAFLGIALLLFSTTNVNAVPCGGTVNGDCPAGNTCYKPTGKTKFACYLSSTLPCAGTNRIMVCVRIRQSRVAIMQARQQHQTMLAIHARDSMVAHAHQVRDAIIQALQLYQTMLVIHARVPLMAHAQQQAQQEV
jgi:hypothetical protein